MDDFFRYGIVIEDESNQLNSITQTITDYYVKSFRTGIVYRLIDTPGFGDTGGINKDEQIMKMIANKFKNDIDEIHSILFVMKASVTRVTTYQQYVFQSVMDLFDKKIAPNFVFIFTFSDSGKPQVLPSVMDSKYGFGNYWN
jgi:GTP-binding protein EngB required for normal cell division